MKHKWHSGLDTPTIILIVLNGAGGLLVAAVIKFGDSILKNFTTSCSVILVNAAHASHAAHAAHGARLHAAQGSHRAHPT